MLTRRAVLQAAPLLALTVTGLAEAEQPDTLKIVIPIESGDLVGDWVSFGETQRFASAAPGLVRKTQERLSPIDAQRLDESRMIEVRFFNQREQPWAPSWVKDDRSIWIHVTALFTPTRNHYGMLNLAFLSRLNISFPRWDPWGEVPRRVALSRELEREAALKTLTRVEIYLPVRKQA